LGWVCSGCVCSGWVFLCVFRLGWPPYLASFPPSGVPLSGDSAPTTAIVPTCAPFYKQYGCTCGACLSVLLVWGWVCVLFGFGVFVLVVRWQAPRLQRIFALQSTGDCLAHLWMLPPVTLGRTSRPPCRGAWLWLFRFLSLWPFPLQFLELFALHFISQPGRGTGDVL
jgi:hypothetical protein